MKYLPFFLLFINATLWSQNLVPNPSFEEYSNCNYILDLSIDTTAYSGNYSSVLDWVSPNNLTPDYFNRCRGIDAGVPNNFLDYQQPKTGNAYTGIVFHFQLKAAGEDKKVYRECLQTKLNENLIKDNYYCVKFYISTAVEKLIGFSN